jgi:hypothetical protein
MGAEPQPEDAILSWPIPYVQKLEDKLLREGKRLLPNRQEQPGGSMMEGGQFQ